MGKMNKWQILFYVGILLIIFVRLSTDIFASDDTSPITELRTITNSMDNLEIELSKWQLYSRQHVSRLSNQEEVDDELFRLKEKTKYFHWESFQEGHNRQKKAVATLFHPDLQVTETLSYIVYPHHEQLHTYLIYDIQGTKKITEEQWKFLSELTEARMDDFFLQNSTFFTCVTGNSSDKLILGLDDKVAEILEQFSAKKMEQLNEETFISVSAYTNTWNNQIISNGQKMNLQIAIRATEGLGGSTTVTIGTPIITTEY